MATATATMTSNTRQQTMPVRPYKDFLTPALHRRFTSTAGWSLAVCYVEAILMSKPTRTYESECDLAKVANTINQSGHCSHLAGPVFDSSYYSSLPSPSLYYESLNCMLDKGRRRHP